MRVRSSDGGVSGSASAIWTGLPDCRCERQRRCSASRHLASTRNGSGCLEILPGRTPQIAKETAACINAADGRRYELALEQNVKQSKIVPQTYGYVLHFYPYREESKSLAPDGSACDARTRGVLQRASIVTGQQWYVGKETDRRWEFGENLALLRASKAMVYRPGLAVPPVALQKKVAATGRRALMRQTGLSQHTLEAVCSGRRVRPSTLHRLLIVLN